MLQRCGRKTLLGWRLLELPNKVIREKGHYYGLCLWFLPFIPPIIGLKLILVLVPGLTIRRRNDSLVPIRATKRD